MRFGLALPHYDTSFGGAPASWGALKEIAITAERSGFDSLWVSDHLFLDWGKYGGPSDQQGSLECWTSLAGLAAVTDRVRLGSLALCNDLRNPALVAKMAASLDLISGGRLDLGIGGGWYEPEYRSAGIPFDGAGTRIRRAGEAASLIARLLEGEEVTFSGRYYTVAGAICRPGPQQQPRPPIWMGGKGDLLLKTAARHADGWNMSWLGTIEMYEERLAAAEQACETVGRDSPLRRSVGVYLVAGTDEADAERRYQRLVKRTPPGVLTAVDGGGAVSWEEFKATRIAGTVGEVTSKLGRLADLGVEEAIVTLGTLPFQLGDIEDIELVGSEIIPALRNERKR